MDRHWLTYIKAMTRINPLTSIDPMTEFVLRNALTRVHWFTSKIKSGKISGSNSSMSTC